MRWKAITPADTMLRSMDADGMMMMMMMMMKIIDEGICERLRRTKRYLRGVCWNGRSPIGPATFQVRSGVLQPRRGWILGDNTEQLSDGSKGMSEQMAKETERKKILCVEVCSTRNVVP